MPSARTIDLEALLTPIAEDNPAGESMRFAGPYDAIVEARRADDTLNQGDWKREGKVADWAAVAKIATETLTTKTKDLQIAGWLTEALVKLHGFAGLRDGLDLMSEIHRRFWETYFPRPEEGDLEERSGKIEWLNERLPMAIGDIPLTSGVEGAAYSLHRYQESRSVDELVRKSPDALQTALAEGKITGEQFDKAVAAGRRAFYENLFADISQAAEQCAGLATVIDEKFGNNAPSLLAIAKAIEDCTDLVASLLKTKRQLEPDQLPVQAQANGMEPSTETAEALAVRFNGSTAGTPVNDREEALRQLLAIAEYFHRVEPHSPVAYLVQRAVRWGQMPLEKWLTDVISDQGVLAHIRETLGIKDSEQ